MYDLPHSENMDIAAFIDAEMRRQGINQSDLQRMSGISQATLSRTLSGATIPETKTLKKIFNALGIDPMYAAGKHELEPAPDLKGTVPLINDVPAGDFREMIDNLTPGEGERVTTSYPIRRHTFALRVKGDSMEPDFPAGIILIVEPDREPLPGNFVIAKNGNNETTFKQLVKDGSDWYLKPLNTRYPLKLLGDAQIVGVVLEAKRMLV